MSFSFYPSNPLTNTGVFPISRRESKSHLSFLRALSPPPPSGSCGAPSRPKTRLGPPRTLCPHLPPFRVFSLPLSRRMLSSPRNFFSSSPPQHPHEKKPNPPPNKKKISGEKNFPSIQSIPPPPHPSKPGYISLSSISNHTHSRAFPSLPPSHYLSLPSGLTQARRAPGVCIYACPRLRLSPPHIRCWRALPPRSPSSARWRSRRGGRASPRLFFFSLPLFLLLAFFFLPLFFPFFFSFSPRSIGTIRFLACYLISGIASSAGVVALTEIGLVQQGQLIGASGCILGVVGAWAGLLLRHRHAPFAKQRLANIGLIVAIQIAFDLIHAAGQHGRAHVRIGCRIFSRAPPRTACCSRWR